MKQSHLFTKVTKETPKDEASFNAKILIRTGFVDKLSAGIYSFLPLGLRVHDNICRIVREEIEAIGGQEILMPALTPKEVWQKTGRWETFDALFKLTGEDKKEYALGATHEEIVTPMAQKYIFSYKELPAFVYQIQTKFRNELRAKAGLIRGREFSMKDLYSFHRDEEDLNQYYKAVQKAYFKILERCGLLDITYLTYASGGAFSKYSHEFQTLTKAGEDTVHICPDCDIAVNEEIVEDKKECPQCGNNKLRTEKGVEVGNIFKLGTRFSKPFGLSFSDKDGNNQDVVMGCYGIGPSRIMGTIVEVHHDDKGIIWPEEVAPYAVHMVQLPSKDAEVGKTAEKLYSDLEKEDIPVLFDDRKIGAGEKFAEADLIGCPYRIVVSEKTLKKGAVELKKRAAKETELVDLGEIVERMGE